MTLTLLECWNHCNTNRCRLFYATIPRRNRWGNLILFCIVLFSSSHFCFHNSRSYDSVCLYSEVSRLKLHDDIPVMQKLTQMFLSLTWRRYLSNGTLSVSGGLEFTLSSRGSVPYDSSLHAVEKKLLNAVNRAMQYLFDTFWFSFYAIPPTYSLSPRNYYWVVS